MVLDPRLLVEHLSSHTVVLLAQQVNGLLPAEYCCMAMARFLNAA